MKTQFYSVGISDLLRMTNTNKSDYACNYRKKTEVKNLIDQTRLGVFENKPVNLMNKNLKQSKFYFR